MKIVAIVLVIMGLLIFSCKNRESENSSTEPLELFDEDGPENDPAFAKLLDRLENYILTDYLTERDLRVIPKDQRKFQLYQIDLNNDGKQEILLNFVTDYFCGSGGCNMVLLDDELRPTEFTEMQPPIYAEVEIENGWKVLKVRSNGKWRKLIYEDGSYPSNPSLIGGSDNPPSKAATILFDNENSEVKTYTF